MLPAISAQPSNGTTKQRAKTEIVRKPNVSDLLRVSAKGSFLGENPASTNRPESARAVQPRSLISKLTCHPRRPTDANRTDQMKKRVKKLKTDSQAPADPATPEPTQNEIPDTEEPPIGLCDLPDDLLLHLFEGLLGMPDIFSLRFSCRRVSLVASAAFVARAGRLLRAKDVATFCTAVRHIQNDKFRLSLLNLGEPVIPANTDEDYDEDIDWSARHKYMVELALFAYDAISGRSLGYMLKHAGVPGDSALVSVIARGCGAPDRRSFAALLRAMNLSLDDLRCQIEVSRVLVKRDDDRYDGGRKPAITVKEFLEALGLPAQDCLALVRSLYQIGDGDRFKMIMELADWYTSMRTGDLACFAEVWQRIALDNPTDPEHYRDGVLDLLRIQSFEYRIFTFLSAPNWVDCGRVFASLLRDERRGVDWFSRNGAPLLRGMVERTISFPHLKAVFGPDNFRHLLIGIEEEFKHDSYAAELIGSLFDENEWPTSLPIQVSHLGLNQVADKLPLWHGISRAIHKQPLCSMERLLEVMGTLVVNDENLISLCTPWSFKRRTDCTLGTQADRIRKILSVFGCSNRVRGAVAISRSRIPESEHRIRTGPSNDLLSFPLFGRFDWDPAEPDSLTASDMGEIIGFAFVAHGLDQLGELKLERIRILGASLLGRKKKMLVSQPAMKRKLSPQEDPVISIRLEFLEGLIRILVREFGADKAVGYLAAILYDSGKEWFPPDVLVAMFPLSRPFQALFEKYDHVAKFLLWYAFSRGRLPQTRYSEGSRSYYYPVLTRTKNKVPITYRSCDLLGFGKINVKDPISRRHKADLVAGGLIRTASIIATATEGFRDDEPIEFGPIAVLPLEVWREAQWACPVEVEGDQDTWDLTYASDESQDESSW